ncbi:MAG: hypothetical protein AB7H71_11375, partial [Alphaproteobacteria bacterium]
EDDLINVDAKIANWSWYRENQREELKRAIAILKQVYASEDLEDPQLDLNVKDSDPPDFRAAARARRLAIKNLLEADVNRTQAMREKTLLVEKREPLQARINGLRKIANNLLYGPRMEPVRNGQTETEYLQIPPDHRPFTTLAHYLSYPIIGELLASPSDFLVMLVAMFMGAVGGVLSVGRAFVDPKAESPSRAGYFLYPIFGFIIALVVFVLFKAGQLALSATPSDAAALDPFVVGFLGVMSGIMARPALDRIERAGVSLFGADAGETSLYARTLKPSIEDLSPQDKAMLLQLLRIDPATLDRWLDEREPIAPANARILSAFFRRPIREMFSSQPA